MSEPEERAMKTLKNGMNQFLCFLHKNQFFIGLGIVFAKGFGVSLLL